MKLLLYDDLLIDDLLTIFNNDWVIRMSLPDDDLRTIARRDLLFFLKWAQSFTDRKACESSDTVNSELVIQLLPVFLDRFDTDT